MASLFENVKNKTRSQVNVKSQFNTMDFSDIDIKYSNYDKIADFYFNNDYIKDREYKLEVLGDLKNFRKLRWMEETWELNTIGCITIRDAYHLGFDEYLESNRKFHFNIGEVLYFNCITLFVYLKVRNSRSKVNWRVNEKGHTEFKLSKYFNNFIESEGFDYTNNKDEILNNEQENCNTEFNGKLVDFDAWAYGDGKNCYSEESMSSEEFFTNLR